ncbi:uncharacterized protein [Apostichopus japonicus]|uniref:uncharacterized protein isoform X2 n=1 Tax=Stichopus japonicus TaxID=307972 RepID=UPI003AB16D60
MADDPEQFLMVDKKSQLESQAQSYDGKKQCWVADEKDGFLAGEIISTKGEQVTIKTATGKQLTLKKDDTMQMNPPKFEKIEDMAGLTYLNEASVLHNLKQRYYSGLIYTYSGLFCVAINPYRRLPIYTDKVVMLYKGKRRVEMPPHVYSIADNAYHDMLQDHENQSMLITGESGAGKTENTKKVIQYFANIASSSVGKAESQEGGKKGNLEDQVIQANPPLEAWGNAKTIRNDNSSRFGKFIRIHFGATGKLAGADIETYLLEKSRVIRQAPGERSYHIFYQLTSGIMGPEFTQELLISTNPKDFHNVSQGTVEIDNIKDDEEMKITDDALTVLGFEESQKKAMYKLTAGIMIFGNVQWKQNPRDEQADIETPDIADKVAYLLGVNGGELIKNLLRPRIKVGSEYVQQGRSMAQVVFSVGALCKAIYNRMFSWMVAIVNKNLDTKATKNFFIGVLDIAGFEIFEFNSFEQICINLTNEKLQQFFNHHMFILEQEEYKREGIQWEFIDFGLDLQACITLIEGPMGIFAVLEEECIVPKATDLTFLNKLVSHHDGKSPNFSKPSIANKRAHAHEIHMEVHHYAGTVPYNVDQWLDKNKDPLNEAVVELLKKSTDPLCATLFEDKGASTVGKKKKGGSFQTVSALHREQLTRLMTTLGNTKPHFVRCIIPNEHKKPGVIDSHLVLHQLACNGVLEGIRICRKGFPNRIGFNEFKQRYNILAPSAVPQGFMDSRKAADLLLQNLDLEANEYRMGFTKVFFRAGVLGRLEEMRDERLGRVLSYMQARIRGFIMRCTFKKLLEQRVGLQILQRNIRKYLVLRNWGWWRLYTKVKPLLNVARAEDDMKAKIADLEKALAKVKVEEENRKELEARNASVLNEKNELVTLLQTEQENAAELEENLNKVTSMKSDLEAQLQELTERLEEEEDSNANVSAVKRKLEQECGELKKDIEDLEITLSKAEEDKKAKEATIKTLQEDCAAQEEVIAKVNKEKAALEELQQKTVEDLQAEEDKVNHLSKVKVKLEANIEELEDNLEHEKKGRADVEKVKRKLEGDLKMTQETVEELEHAKHEMEETIKKRDNDINQLNSRLEDEQSLVAQLQRKIKELQARIEELEEELEAERQARAKAEKTGGDLSRELEDLGERLEEQGGATEVQVELNKKRESELSKLKRELEDSTLQHEQVAASLRKKHQDTSRELQEQVEQMQRAKSKLDKEKNSLRAEIDDLAGNIDYVQKGKLNAEKTCHQLEAQLAEANSRLEEQSRSISDLSSQKSRLSQENNDLSRQIEESESNSSQLGKARAQLSAQLEDYRRQLEEESRSKHSLANQLKQLQEEIEQLREQAEEEAEGREDAQRQLTKVNAELAAMKAKFDGEAVQRAEELEEARRKLQARLVEVEDMLNTALTKNSSLEKTKARLNGELEDSQIDLDRANQLVNQLEKKQKNFDKTLEEWKARVEELSAELEAAQRENRNVTSELYKTKNMYEETCETVEITRRENRSLQDELADLIDQLGEGGRNVHELEKARKRLELEKEELLAALEETRLLLETEEAKVSRAQLEVVSAKQESERRVIEKEEEIEQLRRTHVQTVESMQATLESESKAKGDAQRLKKKLEGEVNELEVQLDHANRTSSEALKTIKKLQQQIRDMQTMLDDESRAREDLRDQYQLTEKRCTMLMSELEETRSLFEQSERSRKGAENELADLSDRVGELTANNNTLASQRRKAEQELQSVQSELEEAITDARNNEDKAKKAISDATRLADELRSEQEHVVHIEKVRISLETQVKEYQVKLDEAEAMALKGGQRQIEKMQARIRELEHEMETEQRRRTDSEKSMRKQERRIKEISFAAEEDRKTHDGLREQLDKFNTRVRILKRQLEEAEETATANLQKFKNAQIALDDAEERVEIAEGALTKMRTKNRGAVMTSRVTTKSGSSILTKSSSRSSSS